MEGRKPDADPGIELGRRVDEYLELVRSGQPISPSEFLTRYPECGGELKELLELATALEAPDSSEAFSEPRHRTPLGPEFGEFKIVRELGRGGMGIVYEAIQTSLNRRVALKVLSRSVGLNGEEIGRFYAEAQAAARLDHPNIVSVYSIAAVNRELAIAMQLIDGVSADEIVSRKQAAIGNEPVAGDGNVDTPGPADRTVIVRAPHGKGPAQKSEAGQEAPMSEEPASGHNFADRPVISPNGEHFEWVARIGLQLAEGLSYAHRRGIIHRDIKPANILIDSDDRAWLTDFGLAKLDDTRLTRTGEIVGTLRYLAPERLHGVDSPQGDLYSLGATLYELATFQQAFQESDRQRLLLRLMSDTPQPPIAINPIIPRDLDTIIRKAMARSLEHRYATADELADDLQAFIDGRPIQGRRMTVRQHWRELRRRNPLAATSIVAVGVLLLTTVVITTVLSLMLWSGNRELVEASMRERQALMRANQQLINNQLASAEIARNDYSIGRVRKAWDNLLAAYQLHQANPQLEWDADRVRQLAMTLASTLDLSESARYGLPSEVTNGLHSVGFNPDLKLVAFQRDSNIEIFDVKDAKLVGSFPTDFFVGDDVTYTKLEFSPDGRYLAAYGPTYSEEAELIIWDIEAGSVLFQTTDVYFDIACRSFDFASDASECFYFTRDHSVVARSMDDVNVEADRWKGSESRPLHIRAQPRGFQLLVLSTHQPAALINRVNGSRTELERPFSFASVGRWDHDGRFLALGVSAGDVTLWDMGNYDAPAARITAHPSEIENILFHPSGRLLVTSSKSGETRLWSLPHLKLLAVANSSAKEMSSDGRRLAFVDSNNEWGEWYLSTGQMTPISLGHIRTGQVVDVEFDASRERMFAAVMSKGLYSISLTSLNATRIADDFLMIESMHCRDGEPSVLIGAAGKIEQIDLELIQADAEHDARIAERVELCHEPDAIFQARDFGPKVAAIAVKKRELLIYDKALDRWTRHPLPSLLHSICVAPDGKWLALTSDTDAKVFIFDLESNRVVRTLSVPEPGGCTIAISPQSNRLVVVTKGQVTIYDSSQWTAFRNVPLLQQGLGRAVFSPDGRTLAIARLKQAMLLDADSGKLLGQLTAFTESALSTPFASEACGLAFSADGALLAVGTKESEVQLWDVAAIKQQLEELDLAW